MLLISAIVLGLCVVIVDAILRLVPTPASDGPIEEQGVGGREALRLLAESNHLKVMALVIGCAAAGAAIVQQQLSMAAEATGGDTDRMTAFLAEVTAWVSIAGFVCRLRSPAGFIARWAWRSPCSCCRWRWDRPASSCFCPGALWAPQLARVLDATLRYTVDKTTREVLFLPLPLELKHRAKPFIDVTADRFSKRSPPFSCWS